MKQYARQWVSLGLLLALLLGLGPISTTSAQGERATTVRLGYLGSTDSDMAQGLKLAIQQINESGGVTNGINVYQFELLIPDTAPTTPDEVDSILRTYATQGVLVTFGPEDDALALASMELLTNAPMPIISPSYYEDLLANDVNSNVYRAVAPEHVYRDAVVNYLGGVLGLDRIIIVQANDDVVDDVADMTNLLNTVYQITPSLTIQVTDQEALLARAAEVLNINPEAMIFYGSPADARALLEETRRRNWQGLFVYEDISNLLQDPAFTGAMTEGVIGVDAWTYGSGSALNASFVAQYVAEYGEVPTTQSVAGYDTMFAVARILETNQPQPATFGGLLAAFDGITLVRGPINPALYGGRILSMTAYIFALTGNGGTQVVAIYDNGTLRSGSISEVEGVAAVPTATPRPTSTPLATVTAAATATPAFLTATVTAARLNVRSGPGTEYDRVAQLEEGDQVRIIGHDGSYSWYIIQTNNQIGWVTADLVDVFDPGNQLASLVVVPAPATPTPGATSLPNEPDLVITNVEIIPSQPQPGCSFTARATVTNQGGGNAGGFAVATTFIPSDSSTYVGANVPSLASGASVNADLIKTLSQTTYVPNLAFVADLNDTVAEGNGENNNQFIRNFKIDKPLLVASTSTSLTAPTTIDFFGGTPDMTWDGTNFTMAATGKIGTYTSGTVFEETHYDGVPSVATTTTYANPLPNVVLAFITVEGHRGVMRIDGRNGNLVTITYIVYSDTSVC